MVRVIGIKIIDRIKEAGLVQKSLSAHAGVISTRLGFHELSTEMCGREGFILIHLAGEPEDCEALVQSLRKVEGIIIKEMKFSHGLSDAPVDNEGVTLMGIVVPHRDDLGMEVQKVLTSFGCVIRTRLGVNEVYFGEPSGLILLELAGERTQFVSLERSLREIDDIAIARIAFPG